MEGGGRGVWGGFGRWGRGEERRRGWRDGWLGYYGTEGAMVVGALYDQLINMCNPRRAYVRTYRMQSSHHTMLAFLKRHQPTLRSITSSSQQQQPAPWP